VECKLKANANYSIPATAEERAIHILSGEINVDNVNFGNTRMLILKPSQEIKVSATTDAHFIILGGTPLEQPRHVWWNFVASSRERIEQAKQDWKEGKFGKIPGDDKEFIPLPE
jgi:redox-sensitive bicupin YhaK (pirin superfamily)